MGGFNPAVLMRHEATRQFVKFCIIGVTSTVIDVVISSFLTFRQGWNPNLARVVSMIVAVCNGFFWNSIWTFKGMGVGSRHAQFIKFVAINVIGLVFNLLIMNGVFYLSAGRRLMQGETDKLHYYLGLGTAIVIVSTWNFLANRRWTFAGTRETDFGS